MSKPLAPRANWERIGDRFYRKIQLYDDVFDADLELENYTVTGAPYSGAVGEHCPRLRIYIALTAYSATPRSEQDLLPPGLASP